MVINFDAAKEMLSRLSICSQRISKAAGKPRILEAEKSLYTTIIACLADYITEKHCEKNPEKYVEWIGVYDLTKAIKNAVVKPTNYKELIEVLRVYMKEQNREFWL